MHKIFYPCILLFTFTLYSVGLFGQSAFEADTALAFQYKKKIDKYIRISQDTTSIYLDSIKKLEDRTSSSLAKGICIASEGYVYYNYHKYDSAIIFFNISKEYFYKQMDTSFYLKLLNLNGVCYNYLRDADNAIKQFEEAISILLVNGNNDFLAKNYYDLSNSYSLKSDYNKGIKYLSLADSIYKKINVNKYRAYLYNSMAIMYFKSGDINKSKNLYIQSISNADTVIDYNLLASVYLNLGDLYSRGFINYDSAIYFLNECLNLASKYNLSYLIPLAQINLSSAYYGQKKYSECINILRDNLNSEKPDIKSAAWINTGIALYQFDSDSAKYYLSEGVKYALDFGDLENLLIAYKTLYSIDSAKHNFESALNNYILLTEIKDSINIRDLKVEIARNEERQEMIHQKKKKEFWENKAKMAKDLAKSKTIRNTLLLVLLSFAVVLIIFIDSLRRKNKAYHQNLKVLHEKLIVKKKLLESNNVELTNLVNTKNTLFSIISHDLRSPIGTGVKLIDLINENFDDFSKEEIGEILKELKTSSENVFELLNNLLEWSRVEQGRLEPKFETFNLNEALMSYIPHIDDVAKNKEIDIELSVDESVVVRSDHNFLSTIFRNLMSNAIKFTPRGGKIVVEGKYENGNYLLCIIDQGKGMKPKFAKNIFNIDSKETNLGTENEKGSGFGLKLVKSMVDKLGAEITVESTIGKGSVFCVRMPLVK